MFWSHQLPGVPSLLGLYLLFVFNKHSPMEKKNGSGRRGSAATGSGATVSILWLDVL